ncbi:DUF302 domain-containing protein [Conexivisphaera calida]|nr:DUF302 domain-containing protein [Conexivisphaera calida]
MRSRYGFEECEDRLRDAVAAAGMRLFAEIDHGGNAADAGVKLRRAKVFIFGNPRAGSLLMQENIEVSYDLPLRIAIWEADDGNGTMVAYRTPGEIAEEHGVTHPVVAKMDENFAKVLGGIS